MTTEVLQSGLKGKVFAKNTYDIMTDKQFYPQEGDKKMGKNNEVKETVEEVVDQATEVVTEVKDEIVEEKKGVCYKIGAGFGKVVNGAKKAVTSKPGKVIITLGLMGASAKAGFEYGKNGKPIFGGGSSDSTSDVADVTPAGDDNA